MKFKFRSQKLLRFRSDSEFWGIKMEGYVSLNFYTELQNTSVPGGTF